MTDEEDSKCFWGGVAGPIFETSSLALQKDSPEALKAKYGSMTLQESSKANDEGDLFDNPTVMLQISYFKTYFGIYVVQNQGTTEVPSYKLLRYKDYL
jgi:hypothetical protein